jgi:hypothetical protein
MTEQVETMKSTVSKDSGEISSVELSTALSTEQITNPFRIMSMIPFGASNFTDFINGLYNSQNVPITLSSDFSILNPYKKMQDNVRKLLELGCYTKKSGESNSIQNIKWGDYQTILACIQNQRWPGNTWIQWQKSVYKTRKKLASVPNYQGIDGQEDCGGTLRNKCDLLDALVQRCFNDPASGQTDPGIPMLISVSTKCAEDPSNQFPDIRFHWDLGTDGNPTLLHLTMICPL